MGAFLRLFLFLSVLMFAGCGSGEADLSGKAAGMRKGTSERELLATFGQPDAVRLVRRVSTDSCRHEPSAIRALEYHFPRTGAGAALRRIFRRSPSEIVSFCMDQSQKLVDVNRIFVN